MSDKVSGTIATDKASDKPSAIKQMLRALGYGCTYIAGQVIAGITMGTALSVYMGYKAAQQGITDKAEITQMVTVAQEKVLGPMVAFGALITIVFLIAFFSSRKEKFLEQINFKKTGAKAIGASAVVGIALNCITVACLMLLPESITKGYVESSSNLTNQSFIPLFISTVIAAPIIEEIIFRGLIFDRLKKGMPTVIAAIISSICFGMAHGELIWFIYAMILGFVLCFVYCKTGSIRATIALHLAYNCTSAVLSSLPVAIPLVVRLILAGVSVIALYSSDRTLQEEPERGREKKGICNYSSGVIPDNLHKYRNRVTIK